MYKAYLFQQHVQENQNQHVEQVVRPKPNKIYKSKVRPILPWRQKNLTANEGASPKNAATLKDPPKCGSNVTSTIKTKVTAEEGK